MKREKISTLIQLGDFFDNRNHIRVSTVKLTEDFIKLLEEYDIDMFMPLGNHDVAYKNSNHLNTPELLLAGSPKTTIFNEIGTVSIHGKTFDFIPWINHSNLNSSLDFL